MKNLLRTFFLFLASWVYAQDDVDSIAAVTDRAEVATVSSTAELVETQFGGDYLYPPANVLNWKGATTWAPGGRGIDQTLTISFVKPISYDEIQIVNGFGGPNDLYAKNNRIKTLQISHVAGKNHFQNQVFELQDQKPTWQPISFTQPQVAKTVSFTIKDIFRGNKYDDTCLSGVRFLFRGKVIPYVGAEKLLDVQTRTSKALLGKNSSQDFLDNDLECPLVADTEDGYSYFFHKDGTVATGTYSAGKNVFWIDEEKEYTVSSNRVVLKGQVGYVVTNQSLIFIPDGKKGVTINGVYYKRITPSTAPRLDYAQ